MDAELQRSLVLNYLKTVSVTLIDLIDLIDYIETSMVYDQSNLQLLPYLPYVAGCL